MKANITRTVMNITYYNCDEYIVVKYQLSRIPVLFLTRRILQTMHAENRNVPLKPAIRWLPQRQRGDVGGQEMSNNRAPTTAPDKLWLIY